MKRREFIAASGGAGAWSAAFVAGCVGLSLTFGVASAQQEPIRIGLLLTYRGPTAIFARYEDKGARLAIDEVNKTGGIQGRTIEIVNYDTEGSSDRAGELYRRLAEEDKVVAVIGPDIGRERGDRLSLG